MHQTFAKLPDYDAETDQYNTLARHYTPSGRWMSPDPDNAGASPSDPQTWNMYAYVRNNPTTFTDPDGLAMNCTQDQYGTIHCTVTDPSGDDLPKAMMELGAIAIPQEEMGPWMPLVGTGLIAAGWCMQTHCVASLTNLLSQSNKTPPSPPATSSVSNTASPNPDDNKNPKRKTPPNQMDQQAYRGQAPKSVDRVDTGRVLGEKPHVEFKDGSALNEDGTWKHGGRPLSSAEKDWLTKNGWSLPKQDR
jgi:RHS repeat-associated protein